MSGNVKFHGDIMTESIENVHVGILSELFVNFKFQLIHNTKKINLQHILYFSAFLTFGMGDGLTSEFMMAKHGAGIESNPFARHLFFTHGFGTVIAVKIWLTMMILFATYFVQTKIPQKTYWTVNGFLIALTVGGLMGMNANMAVITGMAPQPSSGIIFMYLLMLMFLPEIGSFVDRWTDNMEIRKNRGHQA